MKLFKKNKEKTKLSKQTLSNELHCSKSKQGLKSLLCLSLCLLPLQINIKIISSTDLLSSHCPLW